MKQQVCACLLVCAALSMAASDWRREVRAYFGAVPNFEGASRYLQSIYPDVAANGRLQVSFLLAYLFQKLGEKENELFWVGEHYENFSGQPVRFDFLGDAGNIDVTDCYMKWNERYPLVSALAPQPDSFSFAERPSQLQLALHSTLAVPYRLTRKGEALSTGFLQQGANRLALPGIALDRPLAAEEWELEVWSPALSVKKRLSFEVAFAVAAGAEIVDGRLRLKDRSFRPEEEVQVSERKIRYFDRKSFLRRFCLPAGAAAGTAAVNQLFLHRRLADASYSPTSTPLFRSVHGACNLVAIGLAVKALVGFVRSFRTRLEREERLVKSPAAAEYNRFLMDAIRQAEQGTAVHVRLKLLQGK